MCTSPQEHLSCIVYSVFRRPLPCNPSAAHMCISHRRLRNTTLLSACTGHQIRAFQYTHSPPSSTCRGRSHRPRHGWTVRTDCQDGVRSIHVQVVQRSPNMISKINQGSVFKSQDGLQGGTVRTDCQDGVISIHVQVVQRSPENRLYQSTTQVM